MVTALVVVIGGWTALIALLWFGQRQLIYLPDRNLPSPPADVSVVEVETSDGIALRAWLVPGEVEALARVVVFNGNAGHMAHRLPLARQLATEGMETLLFDYRGYGDTEGSPSEEGLLRDARAVAEAAFDTELPVAYLGESIGAGVATALAAERPPSALILRSPFTSLADIARIHYRMVPAGLLLRDRFEVEATITRLEVPVLVVFGSADSIVPPEVSRRVFEAANDPKDLVELQGLDHNDPQLASGRELAEAIRSFVANTP